MFSGHWGLMNKQYHCMSRTSLGTVLAGFPRREHLEHLSYEMHPQMPALTYTNSSFSLIWVTTPGLLSFPPAAIRSSFPAAALPILIARGPLQHLVSQQLQVTFYSLQSKTFTFKYCSRNIKSSGPRAALHRIQSWHCLHTEL